MACRVFGKRARDHAGLRVLAVAVLWFCWPRASTLGPGRTAFAVSGRRSSAAVFGAAAWSLGAPSRAKNDGPTYEPGTLVNFKRVIAEKGLEDWSVAEYEAMRDDEPRTEAYRAAINKRLSGIQDAVVVDIGTGALALLAIMAAKAGAKKVYAIEINPPAAKLAKEEVVRQRLQDKIEVIQGDSMQVDLPERADLIVSELLGSISTQEGVEPIIRDAQKRFLKPGDPVAQMIPASVETRIAPVKYTEHRIMDFAGKRGVMSRGKAEPGTIQPLRLRSKTSDLVFLAKAQTLESFDFANPTSDTVLKKSLSFEVPPQRAEAAKEFSGFCMWTRLVVDADNVVEVKGQKQTSHWAYVVALMNDLPVPLAAPGPINLRASIDYSSNPVRYTLEASGVTA